MANEMKILITGDASSAMGVLNQFAEAVKGTTDQVGNQFTGLTSIFQKFAAPLAAVAGVLGGGALFKGAIDGAVGFSKEVTGLQRLMGGTSQQASVTAIAVKSIFGDVDGYEMAASKLVKTLNKNEGAITAMGVKTRDAKGHFRDMTELLPEVVGALNQYAVGTERDAASQAIFGRSFKDVLIYADMTPEVMDRARTSARALGLEMDGQSQGTILAYRHAMVDVDEAFLGLKTRVALEVMPSLTAVGNWMFTTAPAAIDKVAGGLHALGGILGNTGVQVGIAALALSSIIPIMGTMLVRIPAVSMVIQSFQLQMALAARAGVTGLAAVAGAARGTGSALLGMINPMTVFVAAVAGSLYVADKWAKSASAAADVALELSRKTGTAGDTFRDLTARAKTLDETIRKSTTTDKDKHRAQERLRSIMGELNEVYPGFNSFLKDESGHQRTLAEAIEKANLAREKDLKLKIAQSEADLGQAQIDASYAQKDFQANWVTRNSGVMKTRANDAQEAVDKLKESVKNYKAALAGPEPAEAPLKNHWDGAAKEKSDPYAEESLRLKKQGLEYDQKTTLEAQRKAELEKLDLQQAEDLLKIKAEQEKKDSSMTAGEAGKLRALVAGNHAAGLLSIDAKFAEKRKELEAKLQEEMASVGQKGLDKRYADTKKHYDEMRKLNDTSVVGGKPALDPVLIDAQETKARAEDLKEQAKQDLEALKHDLAEQSQISGPMSRAEIGDKLDAFGKLGASQAEAVKRYKIEVHWDETGAQGAQAGLKAFLANTENSFTLWNNFTTNIVNGITSGLSNMFVALTQKGATFAGVTKAIWMDVSKSVIKGLADMAAKKLVGMVVDKEVSTQAQADAAKQILLEKLKAAAAKDAGNAQVEGSTKSAEAANTETSSAETATTANLGKGTSGFFASYASIPWVGVALAMAGVAVMMAAMSQITAHAVGGVIDKPTLALMGEAGPEIVAPQHDFNHWADANQNLGYHLGAHAAQVSRLQGQAASYGTSAQAQAAINPGAVQVHMHQPMIMGESVESDRLIGNRLQKSLDNRNRRQG